MDTLALANFLGVETVSDSNFGIANLGTIVGGASNSCVVVEGGGIVLGGFS